MTTHLGHKNWLIVSALAIAAFGPVFALAAAGHPGLARWTMEFLNGPGGDAEPFTDGTARFVSALTGGFLLGWGAMVLALRQWVYDLAPEGVRRSLLASAAAWFTLDSPGSIASGNAWNVLINIAVLLLVIGPMWRPAREGARG